MARLRRQAMNRGAGADAEAVFGVGGVADPVQAVFDVPVVADIDNRLLEASDQPD
jgi:hypothetical protein